MQNVMNMTAMRSRTNKFIFPALVFILLIVAGLILANSKSDTSSNNTPTLQAISAETLEEQYGLRVNLIAVTGAGGFVDVRIKIVDGEKAKLLLTDKNNFPSVLTKDNVVLNAPEDTKSQPILFDDNADMFILYPNSATAVTPGSEVRVLFGETVLEPIVVLH